MKSTAPFLSGCEDRLEIYVAKRLTYDNADESSKEIKKVSHSDFFADHSGASVPRYE